MLSPEERKAVGAVTTQLRIIIGALRCGRAELLGLRRRAAADAAGASDGRMSPIAAAMAAACVVAAVVVPRIIAAQQRQDVVDGSRPPASEQPILPASDAGKLLMGYQTRRIIAAPAGRAALFQRLRVPDGAASVHARRADRAACWVWRCCFRLRPWSSSGSNASCARCASCGNFADSECDADRRGAAERLEALNRGALPAAS